jgi:hypothetical protein
MFNIRCLLKNRCVVCAAFFLLCLTLAAVVLPGQTAAQDAESTPVAAADALYLPLIAGSSPGAAPTATSTPPPPVLTTTPAAPPTATATATAAPPTATATATPPPTPGAPLPASLVATWFNGVIPPDDFYDPVSGSWRSVNGLGQMYTFQADGSYVYAGFLRLQNGTCRTEVSVYKKGMVQAGDAVLTLTPQLARTRTVIVCGSNSDVTTDGPYDPYTIGWQQSDDALGRPKLFVQNGNETTEFYKQGMVAALVGSWSLNGVASAGFYDPQSGQWAVPAQDGAWFAFTADGAYRFGEYGHGQDEQGCTMTYWVYQEGALNVSGGRLSYQASSGRARSENSCTPGAVFDEPYTDPKLYEFTWELHNQDGAWQLAISPMGEFRYIVFVRE